MSEPTGSATQPTTDPIERLQREIVTALAGVDVYHADPEQRAEHAVKQNRAHVRQILEKIGDIERAIDFVQLRGVEWCERVKAGQDYNSPVILSRLAEDAAEGWVKPKNPGPALKKKIEKQIAAQLAGKATWKIRAGWLEEWSQRLAAEREQLAAEPEAEHVPVEEPAREPVKLGAVVAELVPAVAVAARRSPQPAEEVGERPAWWQQLVRAFGADVSVSLAASACAGPLMRATVRLRGGRLLLERNRELLQHEVELLDLHAAEWMAAIARHASEAAGQRLTVCWGTRTVAPVLPVAPREVPSWWSSLVARLRATAAGHATSRAPDAATTARRFELVADMLQAARRAVWSGEVLTVEVDALGQLAAASAVVCTAIGWAVALELDLESEAEVVLVDLSAGEEVWG